MDLDSITKILSLWDIWNFRGAVLASLCFQILLIFLAPLRKRSGRYLTDIIIWSAYLMADWIAVFAIGLLLNNARDQCEKLRVNNVRAALWAPFLLLHLGGPDSITAFSLEDNELWIRHLLRLIVQLVMVAYLFYQAIPYAFWLPTVLVFLAGAIKYGERTRALYLASLGTLKDSMRSKPDAGPNYAQLMEEYSSMKEAKLPAKIVNAPEPDRHATPAPHIEIPICEPERPLGELEVVQEGYKFYKIFRGLIVDHMFSFHERSESREFFFHLKPNDAFKVMEVELNFMYDELFTKMAIVHRRCCGYVFRFTCTVSIVVAFLLFKSHNELNRHDVPITYALLVGAIILDFVALIKILFSDWTIALLKHPKSLQVIYSVHKITSHQARWSGRISQHNLISYCLKKRLEWFDAAIDLCGLKSTFEELWYKYHRDVNEGLKEFIFNELMKKAERAQDKKAAKEICSSRGEGALSAHGISHEPVVSSVSKDIEYDESVLLWHIATDLLYFTANNPDQAEAKTDYRKICKMLSDYLLYLLVMRPTLMSPVAGVSQIRFQDTCAEAIKFFHRGKSISKQREACLKLLSVNTKVKPIDVKGDRSKSVLFDACILAKELKKIDLDQMWEIMSKVWLELLCYGASHCKGNDHAHRLSKGGELITFVWLLMAHFGLGDQFRIEAGHARAKLIIDWEQEQEHEQAENEKDL